MVREMFDVSYKNEKWLISHSFLIKTGIVHITQYADSQKEVSILGTSDRRKELLVILYRRRHDTIGNLAFEFGVSERTIRRDIESLSITEPIYTQTGRYGGGVYMLENYFGNQKYMSARETSILEKIYLYLKNQKHCILSQDELADFQRIVINYSIPKKEKERKQDEKRRKTII